MARVDLLYYNGQSYSLSYHSVSSINNRDSFSSHTVPKVRVTFVALTVAAKVSDISDNITNNDVDAFG